MATLPVNDGSMQINTTPTGNTWRGITSQVWNANNIADEDFARQEQLNQNAFVRDLYLQQMTQEYNSAEAQIDRDWQEKMRKTSYQDVVEDLKLAGLNPILAYDNGGAAMPSGAQASSGSASRSSGGNVPRYQPIDTAKFVSAVVSLATGIYSLASGAKSTLTHFGFGK